MNRGRCQICGRLKGRNKRATLLMHHVQGVPCAGSYHLPLEESDARLAELVKQAHDTWLTAFRQIRALEARRANWIDPALVRRSENSFSQWSRLRRRLDRHRNWPARFARQMETYGYGSPPPAYLLAQVV